MPIDDTGKVGKANIGGAHNGAGGSDEHTAQFMLADLGVLKDFRQDLIQQGETRINFYVTAVSVSLVGVGVVSQSFTYDAALVVTTFVVVGLVAMGIITYVRMVERSIGIVLYARRINRIRRYFHDRDKSVGKYLSFQTYDDVPHFRKMGLVARGSDSFGLPELVAVINSIVASSSIAVTLSSLGNVSIIWPGLLGVGTFAAALFLHVLYHNRKMESAEASAQVNFPSPKSGAVDALAEQSDI